jgi:hypothetical protein
MKVYLVELIVFISMRVRLGSSSVLLLLSIGSPFFD